MKKILLLLILILCSFTPSACSCGKDEPTITATKLEYEMALNQTLVLDNIISVAGTDNGYDTIVSNPNIVSVVYGIITPLRAGDVEVKCRIIGYEDIFVVLNINVRDVYLAKSVSIPKSEITINVGSGKTAINKPQFTEKVTEIPNIVYDTNIVGYDYATGTITARATGETTIKIFYELCQVEFKVKVLEIVYVNLMSVEDVSVYVGDKGTFDFNIYPTNGNQYRFYTHSSSIEVNSYGEFVAKSADIVTIYYEFYTSANSEPTIAQFAVTIYALPDNLDFNIVNSNNETLYYIFKGETNKILFDFTEYELLEDFVYSSNIEVLSSQIETDGNGNKYVLFKALESGEISITISCNREIENVERTLSKTKEIISYDYEQIETIAKYSIYPQSRTDDNEYVINISNPSSIVTELTFSFQVDGIILENNIKLYLVGSSKQEISTTFQPASVGRYTMCVEYNGYLIDEFVVVVE